MGIEILLEDCPSCGGTGKNIGYVSDPGGPIPGEVDCIRCEGSGKLSHAILSSDLIDLFNDMKEEIDQIKEKVDEIKTIVDSL